MINIKKDGNYTIITKDDIKLELTEGEIVTLLNKLLKLDFNKETDIYNEGFNEGYSEGFNEGHGEGFDEGYYSAEWNTR